MSATTEEMTIDIDKLDAEAAKQGKKDDKTAATAPEVVVEPAATTAKQPEEVVTPEQGIEKLKKQLKDSEDARAAAEARAREAAKGEAEARGRAQTTELDLVKNAITTVTQANDALESKYAEAMAAQDWNGAAKLQRQMSDNSAKLAQLEAGKTRLENQPKPTPRAPVDEVEMWLERIGPEYPRSKAWIRAHPEFVRDANKNAEMIAAHEIAIRRGFKADTDEYFRSIEKTLDLTSAAPVNGNGHANGHSVETDPTADVSATAATGGRQAAPAAAPVSRTAVGANGSRPNVVRLTPDEVEMAEHMGMTPEEYARQKVALRKEGKLS